MAYTSFVAEGAIRPCRFVSLGERVMEATATFAAPGWTPYAVAHVLKAGKPDARPHPLHDWLVAAEVEQPTAGTFVVTYRPKG